MNPARNVYDWLDARYDLGPLVAYAAKKDVPLGHHSAIWFYLGGLSMLLFGVQIASGLLLLAYYQPGAETAHPSTVFLTTQVPFGRLIRSVHCWSSHLLILTLTVHMFSTMLLKAYRRPRELTWISGCVLFVLFLGFGFSGYLLPWNGLSYSATSVGTDSVKSIPLVGEWLVQALRGGPDVSGNTLFRFFALHVCLLPMLTFAVLGLHLLFIQRQGIAPPVGLASAPRSMPFFPSFILRDLIAWLLCLALLLTLAVLLPYGPGIPGVDWELGEQANPLSPAAPGIKPEWYFLWTYQLLKEFPPHLLGLEGPQVCLLLLGAVGAGWLLLPWLDRRAARGLPSPGFTDLGLAALAEFGFLMLKAWDVGGGGGVNPDLEAVARISAWWTLGVGLLLCGLRFGLYRQRWFLFTGAAGLHIAAHGLLGLSYLAAAGGAAALCLPALAWLEWRARRREEVT